MSVSLKALVEYSKGSNEDNKNGWGRNKEDKSNFFLSQLKIQSILFRIIKARHNDDME